MARLPLTFASCRYDRVEALRTGDVEPDGIELKMQMFPAGREIFDRMVGAHEFDLAELSSSEFISLMGRGDCPFVALPVFPSRVFRHGYIFVNTRAGIRAPKDLAGRRIGVPLYTQTAAIWVRGHLMHEYGVDLATIRWVQGAVEKGGSHGSPHAPRLLKSVPIEVNSSGKSLEELLAAGEIDALIGSRKPPMLGRTPEIARLFADFRAIERAFWQQTKIFPIMHLIALRRELYEQYPWIAQSLYDAFEAAKARALARMHYGGSLSVMLPWLMSEVEEVDALFGGDAWPYGIEPNRPTLEALVRYMVEQSFISRAMPIEELFVPLSQAGGS
jgi:ABC-type nitrate/sulfonate/bicarbonate transport system substrate-binding protein